jgi:hypothetical protein
MAQKRISPHETVSKAIDGNRVTIVYGRPYTKDPQPAKIVKFGVNSFPRRSLAHRR